MLVAEMPPQMQEMVLCSIAAAIKYSVPANIVLAVADIEGGSPGLWVRNSNGTYDVGYMQFNTAYLDDLKRYGIEARDVAAPGCFSFDLAAWRLGTHIREDEGDIWTKAANYHSRTYKYNSAYRLRLIEKSAKWARWLEENVALDARESDGAMTSGKLTPKAVIEKSLAIVKKYTAATNE